jgi:lysozyme
VSYLDILHEQLPIDEGVRRFVYRDMVGKLTVGIGHNLTDNGVSDAVVNLMLEEDIADAEQVARAAVSSFDALSDVRKAVVVNMAFNLGSRITEFIRTIEAINEARFGDAADGMLASAWAKEVGVRATRLANMMRTDSV